jgi:hypothetical protein
MENDMENNRTDDILKAFFEGRPPFAAVSEFVGHAGSGTPDVFLRWMERMDPATCRAITDELCSRVLDESKSDLPVPESAALLFEIVLSFPESLTEQSVKHLENYVMRREKVARWLNDEDANRRRQTGYRDRWQFALALWNILYLKRSKVAEELFVMVKDQAKDEYFKRSIAIAKHLRDRSSLK